MAFHCQRWPAWASTMVAGAQRPGDQHHGHHRHAQGGLVGDHLGRRPHRPEQRVLGPRRPSGQHDPVDADRGHGQQEQDPHRGIGQLQLEGVAGDGHLAADGHDGEDEEGGDDGQVGRQLEDGPVGLVGDQVLLEEELDPVGQGLGDPEGAGPVGPDPALHVRDDLALEPDHQHDRHHQGAEDHQHLDQHDEEDRPAHTVGVERVAGGASSGTAGASGLTASPSAVRPPGAHVDEVGDGPLVRTGR